MSRVTVTVWGELPAPAPTMVMRPLCEPTVSPLGLIPTVTDPRLLPDAEAALLSVSHVLLDEAVQLTVPGPLLETVSVCVVGAEPFWTAENDMEEGLRLIVGVVTVVSVLSKPAI